MERGTGGVRRGKRGGGRVLYVYDGNRDRIYFLLAWPKNKKASLTEAERKALKSHVKELKDEN